jgi:microcystin-dependent protein
MAQKTITQLQLRDEVSDTLNIPSDDGVQSYRVTAEQIKSYILANENVIRDMIVSSERIPRGLVSPFAGTTAPSGWLFCDGSAVSRSTYNALFVAIGTAHGSGDGSTTFNLPDYRGRFLRGVDGGVARDPDRTTRTAMNSGGATGDAVGSVQGQATKTPNSAFSTSNPGNHRHFVGASDDTTNSSPLIGASNQMARTGESTGSNARYRLIGTSTESNVGRASLAGSHTHTISGGDAETRPINAYVNYIIKF